jgi:hypothetical protein
MPKFNDTNIDSNIQLKRKKDNFLVTVHGFKKTILFFGGT